MSKSIIITGATGNLGGAVTKRLIADGYMLYTTLVPGEKASDDPRIHGMHIDLLNEEECKRYVGEVVAREADLQAGILLVGGFQMGGLADTDLAALDKMLIGARPALQPQDGKNAIAYALSKSLIFRLAEIINETGKAKNVRATVIVPSTIDTAINRQSMPDVDFHKWVPAESIADTIAYLLTDSGSMLRESVIKVYNRS